MRLGNYEGLLAQLYGSTYTDPITMHCGNNVLMRGLFAEVKFRSGLWKYVGLLKKAKKAVRQMTQKKA